MASAQTPRGVNHLVLNVRDLDESHRFWTEIIGFRCVAELKPKPTQDRFVSSVVEGDAHSQPAKSTKTAEAAATGGAATAPAQPQK